MSINNGKKIGAAVALASMFAGGSMSAVDVKSAIIGGLVTGLSITGVSALVGKEGGAALRNKFGAPDGFIKRLTNKDNTDGTKKS